jgi:hypothetical protein
VVWVLRVSRPEILDLKVLIPADAGPTDWNQEIAGGKILIPVVWVRMAVNLVVSVLRVSHGPILDLRALFPEDWNQPGWAPRVGIPRVFDLGILILKIVCSRVCAGRSAGPPVWDAQPARARRLLLPE